MERLLILLFIFISIMVGCDDASLITRHAVEDTASCFESAETTDELYIISLDRNCVDTELSIPPPLLSEEPTTNEHKWLLLATLERDVRQKHWHEFYVQDDVKSDIAKAYSTGQDFLFIIEKIGSNSFVPIQFYFMQPEPPTGLNVLFFSSTVIFWDYWVPETNWAGAPIGIERTPELEGLVVSLDPGSPGTNFQHPKNRAQEWVGGDVEFRITRNSRESRLWATDYEPHISQNNVLKVYTR